MATPKELLELIERFSNNREAYRSGQYNETQLRREFVDPFFKILDWDVNSERGYAEAYKDVIHEDSIKVGGVTKAPDYCFRIGGMRKFFVETKKPSVNLKDDISPAFQLRRYAWSAKLPLSILTDFEEFAVYDCRAKPDKSDKASTARILYLNCNEYAQRWDEIFEIFSRDAVLKGSFDRYAESSKVKKGTAEVDDAFLQEIESWRDTLARNLALRNPELSQRDLNFAVQRTIDRIVFLRICEDRGIEQYGRLMALQSGDRVYERLCEMFYRADERYNSGLFHFQKEKSRAEPPDTLTIGLIIDDKPLKDIIKNLYYPDSPYEFSVLSADMLGQVYEQFLGKVIRLTEGHRAVVEEKPEVRKAGGVYYTPTYIVDYIVKNTVGQLVNSKIVRLSPFVPRLTRGTHDEVRSPKSKMKDITPKEVSKIRILDPACGSGSFLLGAYQYLLDWHRDWYVANDPEKWATGKTPALYQATSLNPAADAKHENSHRTVAEGAKEGNLSLRALRLCGESNPKSENDNWRLTTAERRRILLNNIYGVDIDPQAVEVTKLSLLLKVLEGESEQTLLKQFKLFHERALPDLGNNIKCGNSLIGPNFYEGGQMSLFDDKERYRINVFDWDKEFPEIMKPAPAGRKQGNGGFDVVIGNPPYIRIQTMKEWAPVEVEHYKKHYSSASKGNYDIYVVFVERGLSLLNKTGLLGFILPHKFFNAEYGEPLRNVISRGKNLAHVVHFGHQQIFSGASTYTCLMFLNKVGSDKCQFIKVDDLNNWRATGHASIGEISANNITAAEWNFNIGKNAIILERLKRMPLKLGDIALIFQGLITGADRVFVIESPGDIETDLLRPFLKSDSLHAYSSPKTSLWMLFPYYIQNKKALLIPQNDFETKYPNAWKHLKTFESILRNREGGKWNHDKWYAFGRSQNLTQMEEPKLIIQVLSLGPRLIYDDRSLYMTGGGGGPFYGIRPRNNKTNIFFLLGILNSKVFGSIIASQSTKMRGGYIRFSKQYIQTAPIPLINLENKAEMARHDRLVKLVEHMLELHKQLASAKTDHDKTVIQRQIDATDRQIDRLVYELYGLTEEEIKIVEEGSP